MLAGKVAERKKGTANGVSSKYTSEQRSMRTCCCRTVMPENGSWLWLWMGNSRHV